MNRQQDKSKDQSVFSPFNHSLLNDADFPTFNIQRSTDETEYKHFDKFKLQGFPLLSAFRIIDLSASNNSANPSKKPEIIRKHRGNYRKYTVAEKEEAVKQILEGVDAKEISERYGIPRRNLLRWKKNGCERKEGGGRPTDGEMQLTLYTKIDGKILITEKDIRNEAKRLSKMADFKASKGWYCKFSRRYNQWKKQEREKLLRAEGADPSLAEKDVFLLPQVSGDSSDESDEADSMIKRQQE